MRKLLYQNMKQKRNIEPWLLNLIIYLYKSHFAIIIKIVSNNSVQIGPETIVSYCIINQKVETDIKHLNTR